MSGTDCSQTCANRQVEPAGGVYSAGGPNWLRGRLSQSRQHGRHLPGHALEHNDFGIGPEVDR